MRIGGFAFLAGLAVGGLVSFAMVGRPAEDAAANAAALDRAHQAVREYSAVMASGLTSDAERAAALAKVQATGAAAVEAPRRPMVARNAGAMGGALATTAGAVWMLLDLAAMARARRQNGTSAA